MNKKIHPAQSEEKAFTWADFKLNSDGMVPVIAQDYQTNEVLMLAYMNEEAFNTTLQTGKMTYWSRSRNELWIKGLTSGHLQFVKSLTLDCDNDTIPSPMKNSIKPISFSNSPAPFLFHWFDIVYAKTLL